jgi:hypothetical protein
LSKDNYNFFKKLSKVDEKLSKVKKKNCQKVVKICQKSPDGGRGGVKYHCHLSLVIKCVVGGLFVTNFNKVRGEGAKVI